MRPAGKHCLAAALAKLSVDTASGVVVAVTVVVSESVDVVTYVTKRASRLDPENPKTSIDLVLQKMTNSLMA